LPTRADDMLTRRDLSSCSSSGLLLSQLSSLLNCVPLTSEAGSTSPSSVRGGLVGKGGPVSRLWWARAMAPFGRDEASLFCDGRRGIAVREVDGFSMVICARSPRWLERVLRDRGRGDVPVQCSRKRLRQWWNYASIGETCSRVWQQVRGKQCQTGTAGDGWRARSRGECLRLDVVRAV
jgi:hypothetical protein